MSRFIIPLVFLSWSSFAQTQDPAQLQTIGFQEALKVFVETPIFRSFDQDLQAIDLDFATRDLVLQPTLEVTGARTREARQLLFTSAATRPRSELWNLKLAKPFSTGTRLEFNTSWEDAVTPTLTPRNRDLVEWQVVLSQSLWKDSFGHATRLRWSRETFEKKQTLAETLKSRAQSVVDFEGLYWDWALILKEAELQEKNLKRGREILKWVRDRYNRAAAERTDYLNAQALLTRRELQVSALNQRITQALTQLERYVPNARFRPNPEDLSTQRSVDELASPWMFKEEKIKILPLDYIVIANAAEIQKVRAKEVRDSIRPEFNIEASYGKNAIDPVTADAFDRAYSENNELSSIGVVYRTGLDVFGERKLVEASRRRSDALNQRKEAFSAEADVAWEKLKQEIQDLEKQIESAKALVDVQNKKSDAERDRYRKGRATAFEAITYEQEASEAEITLWSLYALKKKTEARARLFAKPYELN